MLATRIGGDRILSERQIKILHAIVEDYVQTAEPVGSRTLAKKYGLGISSATIRNEMSDLEEMGFIMQPHASAGRIPSDLGYRLFVDRLMHKKQLNSDEIVFLQNIIDSNVYQIDYLMRETAKAISVLTSYAAMVSSPKAKQVSIKHFQLIPVDETSIAAVIVTEERLVRNITLHIGKPLTMDCLNMLSAILNANLCNKDISNVNVSKLCKQNNIVEHESIINDILLFAHETTLKEANIYLSGAKNLLSFPEFNDVSKAKEIFQALEEKEMQDTMMTFTTDGDIEILIGNETGIEELKGCSFVRTSYKLSDNTTGTLGLIGPTRMDYEQAVSVLNHIVLKLERVLKAIVGG